MEGKGLTAPALAKLAGVTPPTVYAWLAETGKRPPKRENIEAAASALGVTYSDLWGAPLTTDERTRLAQLESFAGRVRELLQELERPSSIPTYEPVKVHLPEDESKRAG